MEKQRKNHLLLEFAIIFIIFFLVTAGSSLTITYIHQSEIYYQDNAEDLRRINRYLVSAMQADGAELYDLVEYFKGHQEELKIPFHYPDSANGYEEVFRRTFSSKFPGKVFGKDISFSQLDDETKLAFARWKYLYWLLAFDHTRESYGLDYVYFIYPTPGKEDTMCYMFDGFKEEKIIDGESCLVVGFDAFQDRKLHKRMWMAWENGEDSNKMDVLDNEFGHVYSHSSPVFYQGEKLGLITTELSVGYVEGEVRQVVFHLALIFAVVLLVGMALLLLMVRSVVLKRISLLDSFVERYKTDKDSALASTIRESTSFNDEISALYYGFADMIEELKLHMENLRKVTAERERIGAELSVATQIQASMLPRIFPPFPDRKEFDLFASMDPAKEVGGDFYDFFLVDDTHMALVMADVSGKGVPAALFMSIAKALLKDQALAGSSPCEAISNVNDMLCEENDGEMFVTVWMAKVDLATGEVVYCDAGHENPLLIKGDGDVEVIKPPRKRPPVATIEGIPYQNFSFKLEPGQTIFLYTDGVPEATNASDELYGMERLVSVLGINGDAMVDDLLRKVREDVDAFVLDAPQFDDLTMLAFKLKEYSEV